MPGRGAERKQTGTPRGGKLGRQATGLCGASHDIVSHRIALHSMTLHCTTLPYVASPRFASRQGTSHPGMSGVSRPAGVVNAAPASNQGRPSGFSNGRLHLRWLWISQTCRCFRSQERASAASVWWAVRREAGYRTELPACPALPFPFGGRRVGSRGPGCSGRPAPHFRSRSVGGAWGGRPPGRAGSLSALPLVSLPRRALRGAAKTRAARTPKLGRGVRDRAVVEAIVVRAPGNSRPRHSPTRARGTA